MFKPIKVVDIELNGPLHDITGLEGYRAVKAIVRVQGTPIGFLDLPVVNEGCAATAIQQALFQTHSDSLVNYFLCQGLQTPLPAEGFTPEERVIQRADK